MKNNIEIIKASISKSSRKFESISFFFIIIIGFVTKAHLISGKVFSYFLTFKIVNDKFSFSEIED